MTAINNGNQDGGASSTADAGMNDNHLELTMLDIRTQEILTAIKRAAVCAPDLGQLLETEAARVEAQADHATNTIEVTQ